MAQNNLAIMYVSGKGVTKDLAEAASWRQKAAENGYATAQYSLALMYFDGQGLPRNDPEAKKWVEKAAAQNYPQALRLCGLDESNGVVASLARIKPRQLNGTARRSSMDFPGPSVT